MLFKISKKPLIEENPELKAIPEFADLSDRQLRYIFLVYDYKTPLRQMPLEKRKEEAAKTVGYKYEADGKRLDRNARNLIAGKVVSVENAIIKFLNIQRDEDRESLMAIDSQITQIKDFIKKPGKEAGELEKSVKLAKELPALYEVRNQLKAILNLREEEKEQQPEEFKRELSAIDKFNLKRIQDAKK
jgi:hypothetical protein